MKFFDDEIPDRVLAEDVEEEAKPVSAKLTPFDFINSLQYEKRELLDLFPSGTDAEVAERQYPAFMVNRALSMGKDTVMLANEMNTRFHTPAKLQYDFYLHAIRRAKRFNKWVKGTKIDDLDIVKQYYGFSDQKAMEALRILTPQQTSALKAAMNPGGLSGKKKASK